MTVGQVNILLQEHLQRQQAQPARQPASAEDVVSWLGQGRMVVPVDADD
jgi:hypothetical protein